MNKNPEMSEDLKTLIKSLGATAEMLGIFYKNLLRVGFSPDQALALTATYLTNASRPSNAFGKGDNFDG